MVNEAARPGPPEDRVVVLPGGSRGEVRRAELVIRIVTSLDGDNDDSNWEVAGSADAWEKVLSAGINLSTALRRRELRRYDSGYAGPAAADSWIGMLAVLLGLTPRRPDESVIANEAPAEGRPCCCRAEHFSETEIKVLCLLAEGLSNSEIAGRMNVSGHTVDRHVTHMLRRSGARNRAGLVSAAFRTGVLVADGYTLRPSGRRCLLI